MMMGLRMKKKNIFFISSLILCLLLISSFSTISNAAATNKISPEKQDGSPLLDPPVGVEFDRDPLPIPQRAITFRVYSNDKTLSFVNIKITYITNGKIIYSKEGEISVSVGKPHEMSLILSNYGFGMGKLNVRLWKHSQSHDFDWTFTAKTWGWILFVSVM